MIPVNSIASGDGGRNIASETPVPMRSWAKNNMSGIAGVLVSQNRFDKNAVVSDMLGAISHRGPDAMRSWSGSSLCLGHCMLFTTPESIFEKLPLVVDEGRLVITADARIDNRQVIASSLGMSECKGSVITDSELILKSYEKWGDDCVRYLVGDFAFAIWDDQRNRLFCARDHFGVKPFFYYQSDGTFAFGSEIKSVLSVPGVPQRLNELKVADHLIMNNQDLTQTFYKGILRLPPSHTLTVTDTGSHLGKYWSLDPEAEIAFKSEEEYSEAFQQIFFEAVRCRMRSAFPVGFELSGGLDSSSVVCAARDLRKTDSAGPLLTFSAVFDKNPACDEREYIAHVLDGGGLTSSFAQIDHSSPLTDLNCIMRHGDGPLFIHNFFISRELLRSAKGKGVRIMMGGEDGDSVVSHGIGYLHELASQSNWETFACEIDALSKRLGVEPEPYVNAYALPHLTSMTKSGRWAELARASEVFSNYFRISRAYTYFRYGAIPFVPGQFRRIWRTVGGLVNRNPGEPGHITNPRFAKRVGLDVRTKGLNQQRSGIARTERIDHYRNLSSGTHTAVLEASDSACAAVGIEPRYPFFDKRLVEYCLALPPGQKLRNGWDRSVMRRAMEGVLPPQVQWRRDKSDLSPNFYRSLLESGRELMDDIILKDPGPLVEYVDIPKLRMSYERFLSNQSPIDGAYVVWPAFTLGIWLRKTGLQP
jgi:asparagine synthase (glutamine-hydrolysing)